MEQKFGRLGVHLSIKVVLNSRFPPCATVEEIFIIIYPKELCTFPEINKKDGSQGDKDKVTMRQCQRVCCQPSRGPSALCDITRG